MKAKPSRALVQKAMARRIKPPGATDLLADVRGLELADLELDDHIAQLGDVEDFLEHEVRSCASHLVKRVTQWCRRRT